MKSRPKRKKAKIRTRKIKTKIRKPQVKKGGRKIKSVWPKSKLKKFKQLLLQQREKIVGEVEHITNDTLKKSQRDASGDLSGYTLHMADMASDHYDREFSLGIASNEQRIIFEIDDALRRIQDGTYGICFTCEKPLTKSRLKAVPYARYCVACQQKEEMIQKKINTNI